MDKKILIVVTVVILAIALFFVWNSVASKAPVQTFIIPEGIILFFGEDCPHCKNVEAFIKENNIEQKVQFAKLEVPFYMKTSPQLVANSEILLKVAGICNVNTKNGVPIPFLYDGATTCLSGDVDVINFFKAKAGIQ